MRRVTVIMVAVMFAAVASSIAFASGGEGAGINADEALKLLTEGNKTFVVGKAVHPNATAERLKETAEKGQKPFVALLGCSDSRVPPEILFDRGFGDIFVIRVAGNVADTDEIGTIDYGVEHLNIPLIVVLGHSKCGAVTAVVEGAHLEGNLFKLVDNIYPAADRAKKLHPELIGKELLPYAIGENVWQSVEDVIKGSKIVREKMKEKKLKIVGGTYDIETGLVEWLGTHPQQEQLLKDEKE